MTTTAQGDPRAALAAQAGWNALEAGENDLAAAKFRESLALDPKNAQTHFGAAVAAFVQRRDDDAKAAATRALALAPDLYQARDLLGRLLYRGGDLNAAILVFEDLQWRGQGGAAVEETLARWHREADLRDRMRVEVGSRFTVAFEGAADQRLAGEAIASLERASTRIGDVLGAYPLTPVPVVLYTAQQFHDITRAPEWSAGAFDGTIRMPMRGALGNREEFDRVLAHEFTHALIRSLATRGVPAWLNEGLAVALERSTPVIAAGLAAPMRLRDLDRPFGRLSSVEARRAYDVSGVAARRLLEEAGGFAVANLLRDLGAGVPFDEAFAHRLSRAFADFEASLTAR